MATFGCQSDSKTYTEEELNAKAAEMAKQIIEEEKEMALLEEQKRMAEAERLKKEEQERRKREAEFINALVRAGSKEYDKKMVALRAELDQAIKDEKSDAAEKIRAEIEALKKAFEKYKTEGFK
jgi:hypothetical protein